MVLSILRRLRKSSLLSQQSNFLPLRRFFIHFLLILMEAHVFLRSIVESLVQNTSAIEITETHDELGTLVSLKVDPADMGSIIGRGGKTVDAIRTVLRVFGSKSGTRVNLRILEDKPIE